MQKATFWINGEKIHRELPSKNDEVMPGVKWGSFDTPFTPAFWATQSWLKRTTCQMPSYRLGENFEEELGACLLGGYGMQAELAMAAFSLLKENKIFAQQQVTSIQIEKLLCQPLPVKGKKVRYRFPKQKSQYLSEALQTLQEAPPSLEDGYSLRNWLTELKGIGYKTASWVVRNWLEFSEVAILDIHILRAGTLAGFFPLGTELKGNYLELESTFLKFAAAIEEPADKLDSNMWLMMKQMNKVAIRRLSALNANQLFAQ